MRKTIVAVLVAALLWFVMFSPWTAPHIVAAGVVGGCWGLIYRFFPRSLTALIISHAAWDVCAFVLIPF